MNIDSTKLKVKIVLHKLFRYDIAELMHIHGDYNNLHIDFKEVVGTRQESTAAFLYHVLGRMYAKSSKNESFDFYIYTGDKSDVAENFRIALKLDKIFAYSTKEDYPNVIPVPDFIYTSWKESGINSWEETIEKCIEAGAQPYEDSHLFWIGNTNTHYTRKTLVEISEQHRDIIQAEGMQWLDVKKGEKQKASKFVSLYDHAKYKYLIDVQGNGYSGRLKLLFYLGRPIFVAERSHRELFTDYLKDMENCVIVKEDLSDLVEKVNMLNADSGLYNKIVLGGKKLADTVLSKEYAINYMADAIGKYGKKQ